MHREFLLDFYDFLARTLLSPIKWFFVAVLDLSVNCVIIEDLGLDC